MMPITGVFPNKLIENTQLQSGETRFLEFLLPHSLNDQISAVVFTLTFYDIADEYQGELEKAHWISEPVLREKVSF